MSEATSQWKRKPYGTLKTAELALRLCKPYLSYRQRGTPRGRTRLVGCTSILLPKCVWICVYIAIYKMPMTKRRKRAVGATWRGPGLFLPGACLLGRRKCCAVNEVHAEVVDSNFHCPVSTHSAFQENQLLKRRQKLRYLPRRSISRQKSRSGFLIPIKLRRSLASCGKYSELIVL